MRQAINELKTMIRYKYNYANMVTLLNLSMGCFSLLCVLVNEYSIASIFILIGALLDRLDGKIARKLGIVTDLGKELDSLSDLVSFGVAPGMLLWSISLNRIFVYGSAITIIYILSGAYRLARFNVSGNTEYYVGLPITIAGGILAIVSAISVKRELNPYFLAFLTLFLSYVMISNSIKVKKR